MNMLSRRHMLFATGAGLALPGTLRAAPLTAGLVDIRDFGAKGDGRSLYSPAINKAIQDTGRAGKVYCTGAALPSTMQTFLESGVSKQFMLWSPYWYGYMAAYTAIEAHRGKIKIADGTVLNTPNIGERKIYQTPGGLVTDLSMMVFFRKGHETFDTAIPMDSSSQ